MTLRARLLTGMAAIAVVLAVAAVFITRTTERHLLDAVDTQLDRAHVPPSAGPRGPLRERLSSVYVAGFDRRTGHLVVLAEPNLRTDGRPAPSITIGQARQAAAAGEAFTVDGYRVLARDTGALLLVYALPLDDVEDTIDRLVAVELAATVAVLGVLGLVTFWFTRLGVRPIKQMTETAAAIAAGDLSRRVPAVHSGTEAADLGAALNVMLGRIEASQARLKQFVADASHELRTPITTIRGYAELYRNGGLGEPGELDEAMRRTEQEAVRMGGLVDDLLHLARLDQGRPLEDVDVDLAVLARDAAADGRAVDPARPIDDVVEGPLVVRGDESRLRQVLANLVTNALVHTEPGTPISVRARRDGSDAVVEVVDRGDGMPADVAAHAFERFYRADPARTRHRGGSGLGLSIVEATVGALGGRTELESAPGEGTTVRVVLPLSS